MAIKWQEVEEPLLENRWEIDCVDITLTQNDTPTPVVHTGKGFLRQDEEGLVCFRLYPSKNEVLRDLFSGYAPGNEGKLIPGSSYYSLTATDWYGRIWKCPRVNPDTNYTHLGAEPHQMVSGKAYDLVTEDESGISEDAYLLKMVFRADVEIPANTGTDIVTFIDGKEAGRSGTMNVAIVLNQQFGEFRIRTESGRLFVTCEAGRMPQANFFIRVMEAISFVLGRRMYWSFIEEYREGKKITRIRGQERSDERHMPEPVGRRMRDLACHTWLLFADYLRFINSNTGETLHPCSQHLFSVYQAQQGTIAAKALALSVAVEGVCKELFPEAPEAEERLKGWVKQLRKHCEGWAGFADGAAKTALFDRVGGLLGQLNNVRPKDTMMRLVTERAVFEPNMKAWNRLRNSAAHANVKGTGSLQELVSLCDSVTVLLYHLVFRAIGYEGHFTDYSEYGYPLKWYRGRPVTEEEITVAAYFLWIKDKKKHGNDVAHWHTARTLLESGEF